MFRATPLLTALLWAAACQPTADPVGDTASPAGPRRLIGAPTVDVDGDGSPAGTDCDDQDPYRSPLHATDGCDLIDNDCDNRVDENCGGYWGTYSGDHRYLVVTSLVTWAQADAACTALGANLVAIGGLGENNAVNTSVDNIDSTVAMWIGATDAANEGQWRWSVGGGLSYTRWSSGEPSNSGGNEDCAVLRANSDRWNDVPCDDLHGYVCEFACTGWWVDGDGDGYGDDTIGHAGACGTPPAGSVSRDGDCADADPGRNEGLAEVCDDLDVDENCNGLSDEGDPTAGLPTYALDADGDGYGDDATAFQACEDPGPPYVRSGDCDDSTRLYTPGNQRDLCNGIDEDCDGAVDENCACSFRTHGADTYLFCPFSVDFDSARSICGGYGGDLVVVGDATENSWVATTAMGLATTNWWLGLTDADVEGTFTWVDGTPATYTNWANNEPNDSGGTEDCAYVRSGQSDWNDATCTGSYAFVCELACGTWFVDEDGDGYAGDHAVTGCGQPPDPAREVSDDCDDASAAIHPGATEVCDPADVDEDCSGSADDADPDVTGLFAFFLDRDLDGYGDPDAPVYQCDAVAGVTPDDQDCDDDDLDVSPAGTETCNGRDDDCDSVVDEGMVDGDGDGTCDAVDPCPDDNPDDLNRDGICDSSFSLVALGLAPGRTATVLVSHAPPGQRVYVAATLSGGSSGPCLFTTSGGLLCVELSSPRLLGSAVADTHGSAFLQVAVPSSLPSGATARLQGVSLVDVGALTPVFTVEVP